MSRYRIRKISLLGVLVLAVATFVYFGVVRRQARQPASATGATDAAMKAKGSNTPMNMTSGTPAGVLLTVKVLPPLPPLAARVCE